MIRLRASWAAAVMASVVACSSNESEPSDGAAATTGGRSTLPAAGAGGARADGGSTPTGGFAPGGGSSRGGAAPSGGAPEGGSANASGGKASSGRGGEQGGAESEDGGSSSGGNEAGGKGGAAATGISIEGRRVFVDGESFHVRGVNWNPVPRGETHPGGLDYAGFADQDIALMKAAGINAVRTYERLENRAVLDKLSAAGIYVFSSVYGWWQDDPSVVTARVNAVKDHPAILAWVLGNEWNYNRLYSEGNRSPAFTIEEVRARINEAAELIRAVDTKHPISTIYGEFGGIEENIEAMPLIDLWGINTYRGISHGTLFEEWEAMSEKPMYLGEYGADAYDSRGQGQVDVASQGMAVDALTRELLDNYATESAGVALGGFVFEWADEWWKAGQPDVQDAGGTAPGGGPYPDQTFNEEYWGVVDIDRNPRPAYDALKALYAR